MGIHEIKEKAREMYKKDWGTAYLSSVIAGILAVIPPFLATGVMEVGLRKVYFDLTQGKKADWRDLFRGFKEQWGERFLVYMLYTLICSLWALLFVIPGIIMGYAYGMASYIMVREPELTAWEALKKSKVMTKGYKGKIFLLELSFIGWAILTGMTCGLLSVIVVPWMETSMTILFNEIYEERK